MKKNLPEIAHSDAVRLQVRLARSGLASRRKCEEYIASGRVSVNGKIVMQLGSKVSPNDEILVDGHKLRIEKNKVYIALHKPIGYLCSNNDPQDRPLVKDILQPFVKQRIYNVGRLDFMSSGLLLFTNDGEWAAFLTHPSNTIEKEYIVTAKNEIPKLLAERFLKGININGIHYRAKHVKFLGLRKVAVVLTEGKNREIREVFRFFGISLKKVHRVRIGPIALGDLLPGRFRYLGIKEVERLRKKYDHRH